MKESDYWYLASHYSNHPEGREFAFQQVKHHLGILMEKRIRVYSPIVHNHQVAFDFKFPETHAFWMRMDFPMLANAYGVIYLMSLGWQDSRGMREEIEYCLNNKKPLVGMEIGRVPYSLTRGKYAVYAKPGIIDHGDPKADAVYNERAANGTSLPKSADTGRT